MSWYRTGTVAVTNGSAVVTGTGTAWIANVQSGHAINLPDGHAYEVQGIVSDTSITLGSLYLGVTASGQAYSVQPNQGFAQTAASLLAQLISDYQGVVVGAGAGRFGDGTVSLPAITFSADQATGFYRPGPNAVNLTLGGVLGFSFDRGFMLLANGSDYTNYSVGPGGTTISTSTANITYVAPATYSHLFVVGGVYRAVIAEGGLYPYDDNAMSLGVSAGRWSVVYAASSTISTSDERLKNWRGGLNADELAAAKEIARSIGVYQFIDAVAEKGADGARLHAGVKAQAVIAIMTAHGLDPLRYGFACHDEWDARVGVSPVPAKAAVLDADGKVLEPGTPEAPGIEARAAGDRYGIRYEELAMFLAAAQEQRLAALEAR